MSVSCQLVLQKLREAVPPRFALTNDPTGLQVGTADRTVERVMCCLDLTLEVAREARDARVDLLISHHAVIYRPLRDLRTDQIRGQILAVLLKSDISVYVPHTALDVVTGGLNDWLADVVGLPKDKREPLSITGHDEQAMCQMRIDDGPAAAELVAHAERSGATATFCGPGLLEAVVPRSRAERLVERLDKKSDSRATSWQLVAPRTPRGIGRIGRLSEKTTIRQLAQKLQRALDPPGVRVAAESLDRPCVKVAVLCGDGRSFVDAAIFAGADVLVSGDIDHHTALDARARGLAIVDVGHFASERQAGALLAGFLRERLSGEPVEILVSQVSTQPFSLVQ